MKFQSILTFITLAVSLVCHAGVPSAERARAEEATKIIRSAYKVANESLTRKGVTGTDRKDADAILRDLKTVVNGGLAALGGEHKTEESLYQRIREAILRDCAFEAGAGSVPPPTFVTANDPQASMRFNAGLNVTDFKTKRACQTAAESLLLAEDNIGRVLKGTGDGSVAKHVQPILKSIRDRGLSMYHLAIKHGNQ